MNAPAQAERRKLGKLKWFALVFIVLIAAVLFVSYLALKPANFTPLLLERIGQATGLDIQAKGQTEINWRGTPYIVLREVSARSPGQKTAVLTADRIKIALPWVTLRSRGQVLVLDRVELDAPVLDLQAFRAWQDTRPKTKSEIPDFKRGVSVTRGTVIGRSLQALEHERTGRRRGRADAVGSEHPALHLFELVGVARQYLQQRGADCS